MLKKELTPDFSEVMASISKGAVWLDEFWVSSLFSLVDDWLVNEKFVSNVVDRSESIVERGSNGEHLQFIESSVSEEVRSVSQKCDMEKSAASVVFKLLKRHHTIESIHIRLPDFSVKH